MARKENVLIVHGGGPSAVINCSLYGAVREALEREQAGAVYGAIGGMAGVLNERFVDFARVPRGRLELLLQTPGTAIGTSRTPLGPRDYERLAALLQRHGIGAVLLNGGNGTMDACGKLCRAAQGTNLRIVGIPKTIDNDIGVTDHCPGFGSAARYIAQTTREIAMDVRSMPIHVCVIEAMGRNAGWITAASALALEDGGPGPHMILTPEIPFDEARFLERVRQLHEEFGGVVVVASEGLKRPDGSPIVDPVFQTDRSTYFGDVGAHLAQLITRAFGIKTRGEKPGIAGRASVLCQSGVDRQEAVETGRQAYLAAQRGETGCMIGMDRRPGDAYGVSYRCIPIEQVMLAERKLPRDYVTPDGFGVTQAFRDWCRPLIGGPLTRFVWFGEKKEELL